MAISSLYSGVLSGMLIINFLFCFGGGVINSGTETGCGDGFIFYNYY